MKKKEFDCVEMMHECQAKVAKKLEGMTEEEQLEYWRKGTEEMLARKRGKVQTKSLGGKHK